MSSWRDTRATLREYALSLPEAFEDFPWEGDAVVKVNKKIFAFLGIVEPTEKYRPTFGIKLVVAHGHALSVPGAAPSGYGLGRAGWVTVPFEAGLPELDVLQDWVEESYRLVAPKRLSKLL